MPYNAELSRTNPTCFIFLIDQSSSMAEHRHARLSNHALIHG
jgi:hypothetical protein